MAYVSQEFKAERAPVIKAILKKYNLKGSLSVRHHSTLVLTIKSGALDFIGNYNKIAEARMSCREFRPATSYIDVNEHWIDTNYSGEVQDCLNELVVAMKGPDFFDHSDIQTDYFNRSHYIDINVGRWDKPYELVK